jgi:phytoene desaturase
MIPYLEKEGGVWFSRGGMYSLVEALVEIIEELGGTFKLNTEVERIEISSGKASGVKTKNGLENYDLVVSNAHIAHTFTELLDERDLDKWKNQKIKEKKFSMSCYLAYIGVKKKYPQLKHHTLILSERYKELVDEIFDEKSMPDDFSMYLHVPSRTDKSMAPDNCESMYVLIPTPNLKADFDWSKKEEEYTDKVLNFLENDFGLTGLRENIEVLETYTPLDFESERNNYIGSAWGLQPTLFQSANFRPHNRNEDIENLYLVGASTHPGAGVPGVMLTAETTEKLILEDHPLE